MPTELKCGSCGHIKSRSEFYNDKRRSTGRSSICKKCQSKCSMAWQSRNPEKRRAVQKAFLERNPGYEAKMARQQRARRKYGLSLADYEALLDQPLCDICQGLLSQPHLDHCHASGKIRGVLCSGCNVGLGFFKDNPDVLRKAAKYLEKRR